MEDEETSTSSIRSFRYGYLVIRCARSVTQLRLLPTCAPKIRYRPVDDTLPQMRSHGATGGVCKKQGRILRAIVTRGY